MSRYTSQPVASTAPGGDDSYLNLVGQHAVDLVEEALGRFLGAQHHQLYVEVVAE